MKRFKDTLPDATAPLFHAMNLLSESGTARFHMPGHKGEPIFQTFSEIFAIDFTETYGTGNLYTGEGPIREAELAAARFYHAADCLFLTGGSTQGVLSMLAAAVPPGGELLIDRCCHKSVCTALALLDLEPHFLVPPVLEPFGIPSALGTAAVEAALDAHPGARALLVTSPNYYGVRQPLEELARLCHARGRLLLVDAAHAAHFPAVRLPSPVQEGADCAVLSAHKTLPCLGQGAFLLCGGGVTPEALREAAALFGTSSPSYPILCSLDLARAWAEGQGATAFHESAKACTAVRRLVSGSTPFLALEPEMAPHGLDPCRLTVCTAGTSLTGHALADVLFGEFAIACEMADARNVVFILTGADAPRSIQRLRQGLAKIAKRTRQAPLPEKSAPPGLPQRKMRVREAWFAPHERTPLADASGKVCARPVTPYPPGAPLVYPGEEISAVQIELLRKRCYNEIETVSQGCVEAPVGHA